MLLLNFMVIFLMFIGLLCTLAPSLHGTVVIGIVASIYATLIGVNIFHSWVGVILLILIFVAEVGVNGLRNFFTGHCGVTRRYSVDTTVCNIAGVIIADALLGSFLGTILWEALVGKNLFPRLDSIGKVLVRLMLTAILRLLCGVTMIIIVMWYIMYAR
jgi:uncharacterized protein YqgC (DUF456 family)